MESSIVIGNGGREGQRLAVPLSAAILLALEHAPEQLKQLLPRGLGSRDYRDRLIAAAVLALLDCEWSREVLLDVLRMSDAQDATIEARAALRESTSTDARRSVDRWEAQHLGEGDPPVTSVRFIFRLSALPTAGDHARGHRCVADPGRGPLSGATAGSGRCV